MKRSLLILFLLCFSLPGLAQEEPLPAAPPPSGDPAPARKQYYLFSPRVSITVPHPMANKAFKKCFVGIYEASGGLNIYLHKGFFVGGSGKQGLMKITENKIADYNASMDYTNASGKIGIDSYVGELNKAIFSASVSYGKNWSKYTGLKYVSNEEPPKYTSFTTTFIEPEVNIYFLIESNFGIGATLSYTLFSDHFNPYDLSLNQYTQFGNTSAVSTQFLSFGFGFYYSIVRRK